jgi:hypothetical protein
MQKYLLSFLLVSTLTLTACGSSDNDDSAAVMPPEPAAVVSDATVTPLMSGTPVAISCASSGAWECSNQYGGTITTAGSYAGTFMATEFFPEFNTPAAQLAGYQSFDSNWANATISEEYAFGSGQAAVITGSDNGKAIWFALIQVAGKADYGVRCEAIVDADKIDQYKSDIEEMCSSVKVK